MRTRLLLVLSLGTSVMAGAVSSEAATVRCGAGRHAVLRPIRLNNGARAEQVTCVRNVAVRHEPHRSWKKSALVIGGSGAAGAGVGALVGGKKGALIGGLAGGAAGSAYEYRKRHHHKKYRHHV